MKIVLPQVCTGARILEVFALAATFEIQVEKRWDSIETVEVGGVVISPLFARRGTTHRRKGVDIILSTKKKRWVFFGERVWKPEETPIIRLSPLELDSSHEHVEVLVRHTVIGKEGVCFIQDPYDPRFVEFYPHYHGTLRRFLSKLASHPTTVTD